MPDRGLLLQGGRAAEVIASPAVQISLARAALRADTACERAASTDRAPRRIAPTSRRHGAARNAGGSRNPPPHGRPRRSNRLDFPFRPHGARQKGSRGAFWLGQNGRLWNTPRVPPP